MNSINDSLVCAGLASLLRQTYGYNEDSATASLKSFLYRNPQIIMPYFDNLTSDQRVEFYNVGCKEGDYTLYNSGTFWSDKLSGTASLDEDGVKIRSIHRDSRSEYILAANLIPDFDWRPMFDGVIIEYGLKQGWLGSNTVKLCRKMANQDPEYFKDSMMSYVFNTKEKPNHSIRSALYSVFIESGMLTEKTARKIRSDGSEEASISGVNSLIKNKEKYSNYSDLILKFTDSRYSGVLHSLAKELPIHLLASIMGTTDYWVKQEISRRMEEWESASDKASDGGLDG